MIHGVDTSHYDGLVPWDKLKAQGVQFAFLKASEGLSVVDREFSRNWRAAAKVGLLRGAYHFFRPLSDPFMQANTFLKTVEAEIPYGFPADLPAVLDLEVGEGNPHLVIDGALKWMGVVKRATGKMPIAYMNPSFAKAIGVPAMFASYPLWLAEYGIQTPRVPKPWTNWTFWQYSETGIFSGVHGLKFDLNYFNGTYEQLKAVGAIAKG